MASLDLSDAFDVVNVSLLIKRLKIVGLHADIIELIQAWLSMVNVQTFTHQPQALSRAPFSAHSYMPYMSPRFLT